MPLKWSLTGLGLLLVAFLALIGDAAHFGGIFSARRARGVAYLSLLNRDGIRQAWHHEFLVDAPLVHKVLICNPNLETP